MAIILNLQKGGVLNLAKAITKLNIATGWDPSAKVGETFDLDLWCVSLSKGICYDDQGSHLVVYANAPGAPYNGCLVKVPSINSKAFGTADLSITHTGDDRNGKASGVDELIKVDLAKIPVVVDEIAFFISIYEAAKRNQNFSRVNNTFIRISNDETNEDLCQYNPQSEFPDSDILHIGSMIKDASGVWAFKAVGQGAPKGNDINTILALYA